MVTRAETVVSGSLISGLSELLSTTVVSVLSVLPELSESPSFVQPDKPIIKISDKKMDKNFFIKISLSFFSIIAYFSGNFNRTLTNIFSDDIIYMLKSNSFRILTVRSEINTSGRFFGNIYSEVRNYFRKTGKAAALSAKDAPRREHCGGSFIVWRYAQ